MHPPKIPPPPPSGDELREALIHFGSQEVQEYISMVNEKYYHWDKARFFETPNGLTPEQAWFLITMSRSQKNITPLCDINGKPFTYSIPNLSSEILHQVDREGGASFTVEAEDCKYLDEIKNRVLIRSLMEEAIATSQLEGAVTTREVAKEMLRTKREPRDSSEQMIVNSYRTIQMLRDRVEEPLSIQMLFEIQETITQLTLENPNAAGRFRTNEEKIKIIDVTKEETVYVPPPAGQLNGRVAKLIEFANTKHTSPFIHPLIKAAILHFWLAYEHPFVDGNGRTARALFYWFMLKSGYWLFEFLTISRIIANAPVQYAYSFLYSETGDNDLTYSVMYLLRTTQRAITQLNSYLAQKQEEQRILRTALKGYENLNYRQRAVMERACREPATRFTFQSHMASHNITRVTARKDLLDLVEKGLLEEIQAGKEKTFKAARNLVKKLGE